VNVDLPERRGTYIDEPVWCFGWNHHDVSRIHLALLITYRKSAAPFLNDHRLDVRMFVQHRAAARRGVHEVNRDRRAVILADKLA